MDIYDEIKEKLINGYSVTVYDPEVYLGFGKSGAKVDFYADDEVDPTVFYSECGGGITDFDINEIHKEISNKAVII